MRVYIIQNMVGKTVDMINEERSDIVEYYQSRSGSIVDNVEPYIPTEVAYPELSKNSVIMGLMSDVDLVVYMNDWQKDPRAKYEAEIADRYTMPARYW